MSELDIKNVQDVLATCNDIHQVTDMRSNAEALETMSKETLEILAGKHTNVVVPTQFGNAMESVKLNVLASAAAKDDKFISTVQQNLKSAAIGNTEIEQKKAELEKQKVDFASETLATEQQKNAHKAIENKWENREKRRQYHYNGVKPIMSFVGIEEPLNLFLLYVLTFVLSPFFLLSKLIRGTFGTLIAGACDSDRSKAAKGFLWTLIAVTATGIIAAIVYLFLKWQRLI